MQSVTTLLKAISDGNRLRLLTAIDGQGELCACQLSQFLGVTGATCSQHLTVLVKAGILRRRRQGRWMHFSRDASLDPARRQIVDQVISLVRANPSWTKEKQSLELIMIQTPEDLCRSRQD